MSGLDMEAGHMCDIPALGLRSKHVDASSGGPFFLDAVEVVKLELESLTPKPAINIENVISSLKNDPVMKQASVRPLPCHLCFVECNHLSCCRVS